MHQCPMSGHALDRTQADAGPATTTTTPADVLSDRLRIWEMRRYCQAKPALTRHNRRPCSRPPQHIQAPESSLNAILRCLVRDLDADLAVVSLVDDQTQHFLAGASTITDVHGRVGSRQWDGRDAALHPNALCAQTLATRPDSSVHERLDLQDTDVACHIAPVTGQHPTYRYYAGVPILTDEGQPIGTLFFCRCRAASEPLCPWQREYLIGTASHVVAQLQLVIHALDSTRIAKFNEAVAALTHNRDASTPGRRRPGQARNALLASSAGWDNDSAATGAGMDTDRLWHHAAQLLLHTFEFDGVCFQEVDLQAHASLTSSPIHPADSSFLAHETKGPTSGLQPLPVPRLDELLDCWPAGECFHRVSIPNEQSFLAGSGTSPWTDHDQKKLNAGTALIDMFPGVQQLVYTPLWDAVHDRVAAVAFGWVFDWSRVYLPVSDLFPITAFCMATMNLVQRKEARRTEQQKTNFLGSISHEMRSPLHGNLANIELLLGTSITAEQRDMLETSSSSGNQLLNTIDKILQFNEQEQPAVNAATLTKSTDRPTEIAATIDNTAESDFFRLAEEMIEQIVREIPNLIVTSPSIMLTGHITTDFFNRRIPLMLVDTNVSTWHLYRGHPRVFQTVLLNLLSNAVRYTFEGCIRISVDDEPSSGHVNERTLVLRVADCGTGISKTFLKNRLFVPFMQQDQLGPGTGLGLAIVKGAVNSVHGQINVESDEATGTTVIVRLPLLVSQPRESTDEILSRSPSHNADLSVHLFVPEPANARQARCSQLLEESLSRSLANPYRVGLKQWKPGVPSVAVLVLENDVRALDEAIDDQTTPRLVLCSGIDGMETIRGTSGEKIVKLPNHPISPAKLILGLRELLSELNGSSDGVNDHSISFKQEASHGADMYGVSQKADSLRLATSVPAAPVGEGKAHSRRPTATDHDVHEKASQPTRKPNVLLVDDNAINLKVLVMYSKKMIIGKSQAVTGGQEAIDAYNRAASSPEKAFDIIFMDLSMPEVSGFDATAAIRRVEANSSSPTRAHIVALTGLVSAKDRIAAFEAGVDDYITKPAKIADITKVVERWAREGRKSSITSEMMSNWE